MTYEKQVFGHCHLCLLFAWDSVLHIWTRTHLQKSQLRVQVCRSSIPSCEQVSHIILIKNLTFAAHIHTLLAEFVGSGHHLSS